MKSIQINKELPHLSAVVAIAVIVIEQYHQPKLIQPTEASTAEHSKLNRKR